MKLPANIFPILVVSLMCALIGQAKAQWVQQQIVLKPGWNAVFLEVDPTPNQCDTLFTNLPIESVWDWNRSSDFAQFVQDPSNLIPGAPGWLTWFPPQHPLTAQGQLFALRDGRPYLIKSTNSQSFTWTVTGRPSLRRLAWQAGGATLVGFHVNGQGPTFQTLFAGSSGLTGQPVYSLDASGVWRAVTDLTTTRAKAGEAYWIRCVQPAQATGTILIETDSRQGLSFGAATAEQSLRIRNASSAARNITVRLLTSASPPSGQAPVAGPVPLEYWKANYAATNFNWEPLTAPLTFTGLRAGQEWNIRLGVRRPAGAAPAAGSTYQSVLEVVDDLGTRWVVPVNAETRNAATGGAGLTAGALPTDSLYAGLWIGEAVLNGVSQPAHLTNPSMTRPTGGSFSFRLIMHVDAAGTARLLQHVFLVRKPPVLTPDADDPLVDRIAEPARTVAVTDEDLLPGIIGNAQLVGRRISSPAFAFAEPLTLTGGGFGSSNLRGMIPLDYDSALNPFKHLFHPDHNNLDERYEQKLPEGKESFTVTRSLFLQFAPSDPLGLNPPGWGQTEVGGVYRETISGLHRNQIQVSGTFRLVRVLSAAALNQ